LSLILSRIFFRVFISNMATLLLAYSAYYFHAAYIVDKWLILDDTCSQQFD
jgi:hypothetical protein